MDIDHTPKCTCGASATPHVHAEQMDVYDQWDAYEAYVREDEADE